MRAWFLCESLGLHGYELGHAMRGVQSMSPKNVEGLKAHLSMLEMTLIFELSPAVLRRALMHRSRTMRTASVPWLVPAQLTPRCGPCGEPWLRLTAPP